MIARTNLETRVEALKTKIKAQTAEMEEILTTARAGLTATPTQGAAWNSETRYITGDTVEGGYVALKYNRNKNPENYLGIYWEIPTTTYTPWDNITDGTVIEENTIVTYDNKTWKCISQHIKSTVYKPKTGSTKWEEVTE